MTRVIHQLSHLKFVHENYAGFDNDVSSPFLGVINLGVGENEYYSTNIKDIGFC